MKISKTFLLVAIILSTSMASKAQTGSWYVGGNVGFSSTQTKTDVGGNTSNTGKTTGWSFSPEVGTFLTDHVQLGLGLTLSGSKSKNQQTPETINKGNSYGATIYSRYFFGKDAFKPFVGVNISASPGKYKTTYGNNTPSEYKSFDFRSNINAGFGYAISKKVTAVGSFGFLGFESSTQKSGGTKSTITSFGLDAGTLGNRFTVGFYYTL